MRQAGLAALLLLAAAFVASPVAADDPCSSLDFLPRHPAVSAYAGSGSLQLFGPAGCTYSLVALGPQYDGVQWLHTVESSITLRGTEEDLVRFTFDANPGPDIRRDNVLSIRHASGFSYGVTFEQGDPCRYSIQGTDALSPSTSMTFGPDGGPGKLDVWAGGGTRDTCPETAFASATPWIHLGGGGAFTLDANEGGDREGSITATTPPRWSGARVAIIQRGVAEMDGGGNLGPEDRPGNPVDDAIASRLVNEEPGPEAALVLAAVGLVAVVAARRR